MYFSFCIRSLQKSWYVSNRWFYSCNNWITFTEWYAGCPKNVVLPREGWFLGAFEVTFSFADMFSSVFLRIYCRKRRTTQRVATDSISANANADVHCTRVLIGSCFSFITANPLYYNIVPVSRQQFRTVFTEYKYY